MHHVIERFIGRYDVWRRSVPLRNPLNIPALILITSIAQAVYQIATSQQVAWGATVLLAVDIAFLLLYLRRSPWAWLVLPAWGAMALIQLPFAVASGFDRYSVGISVVAICLLLVVGVGFIAWGFAIRRRYYAFVGYGPEHSHQHLTNR
jgi:hypothetical protein